MGTGARTSSWHGARHGSRHGASGRARAGAVAAALALAAATVLAGCTAGGPEALPAPSATAAPRPSAEEAPASPSASPSLLASPEPSPTEPSQAPDPFGGQPVDVLLIGSDSRDPQDLTGNADTIMLVHLPADRQQVYLVSFTRDMWVEIPGLGEGKINSAFARGGTETLEQTVSGVLGGVDPDVTVQSNFAQFIAVTRHLGGFEVDNQHASTVTVRSTGRVLDFPEGRIRLEGTDGLIYVRERKTLPLGDLDRTERQRAALVGIMDELRGRLDDPAAFAQLVPVLLQNTKVTGDFGPADAIALAPTLEDLQREDVVSLMVPITGFGTRGGASVNLVDEAQTAELGAALREDTMAAYVQRHGTGYAP